MFTIMKCQASKQKVHYLDWYPELYSSEINLEIFTSISLYLVKYKSILVIIIHKS